MKKASCASGIEMLMEYLEGALPADARAAVEAHAAVCPGCVAFLASYRETPRIMRDATAIETPADLETSLLALLRSARSTPPPTDE